MPPNHGLASERNLILSPKSQKISSVRAGVLKIKPPPIFNLFIGEATQFSPKTRKSHAKRKPRAQTANSKTHFSKVEDRSPFVSENSFKQLLETYKKKIASD